MVMMLTSLIVVITSLLRQRANHYVVYLKLIQCLLVAQLYLTLPDSMDCSPPGSSVHGIPQEYWNGLPFPSPGDLPDM